MGGARGTLRVVRAQPQDADTVLSILQDAQQCLHGRGIEQGVIPPRERLNGRIACGEVYLAEVDGWPAATITLSASGEPFWDDPSEESEYVHSFAVRREFGGRALGRELLLWAEGATLLMGKRYLRLDIWGENRRLFGYYRSAGFVHVRDDRSQGWLASLFQKDLSTGVDAATDVPIPATEETQEGAKYRLNTSGVTDSSPPRWKRPKASRSAL